MSLKLELISIPVSDQEKAKEFYMNKLGFELIVDAPFNDGMRWIQLATSKDAETSISLVNWLEDKMRPGNVQGLILEVENIEKTYSMLIEKGVELGEINDTPWGRFSSFVDIDGNGWTIHQN